MSEQAFSMSVLSDDLPGGSLPAEPAGEPVANNAHGATPMAKKISGSVGKGGKNKPEGPTDDDAKETYLQSFPDGGEGMMANAAPDALMFDMPGEEPAIAILIGLLLPAVQKAGPVNPDLPVGSMMPPKESDASRPDDDPQEADTAAAPSDIDLFAAGLAERSDQIEFNYIEIKGSSPAPAETDPDDFFLAPGVDQDPALDQIIAGSVGAYGDQDEPNGLLSSGDGANVLSDITWFEFVDDVLV